MSLFEKLFGARESPLPPAPPSPSDSSPVPRKVPKRLPATIQPREGTPYYDVVCPFCMEKYPVWELEFRSFSVMETEENEGYPCMVDEIYQRFWEKMRLPRRDVEKGFVLDVNDVENVIAVQVWGSDEWLSASSVSHKAIRCVKDKFGNVSRQHICPKCHNDLPPEIGRYPNYIISMMGNTNCGKMLYMSRLLLSLFNGEFILNNQIYVSVCSEQQHRLRRRLQDLFPLFEAEELDISRLDCNAYIPYMEPIILDFMRGNEHILVTLFDFHDKAITQHNGLTFFWDLMQRTNENANGWIFLLDSTTLPPIKSCIQEQRDYAYISRYIGDMEAYDLDRNVEPSEVLRMFHDFLGKEYLIKSPIALVFSKSDMIARYAGQLRDRGYNIAPNSPFLMDSPSNNSDMIDLDDLLACDESIQAFLRYPNGSDRVLNAASAFFDSYAWFAASATGTLVRDGVLERVAPAKRVLEPLKWLLWRMGAYTGQYTQDRDIWGMGDPWPPQG